MKRLHAGRVGASGPEDHGPHRRSAQAHGRVWYGVVGLVLFLVVTGWGGRGTDPLRPLQAPLIDLSAHPLLQPGVATVFDALSASDGALADVRFRRGELLAEVATATIVRRIAEGTESGRCAASELQRIRAAARLAADASARVLGALAFVEAEVLRCRGDEDGAVDAWLRASSNHRLRPVIAMRLRAAEAWSDASRLADPSRPAAGAIAAWAARPGDLSPSQRAAAIDLLAAARPAAWLVPRIEAARYALLSEDDPRGAAIARARWLADHGDHARWRARLDALLESRTGAGVAATTPALHDALLDRAADTARAGRRSEARGLIQLALTQGWLDAQEASSFDDWQRALVDLGSARREDQGRQQLEALMRRGGRVAIEAAWALIGDARREDRDAEALQRIAALRQRAGSVREVEMLDACVVLAGHLGQLDMQRACFSLRMVRGAAPERLGELAIEVVVDHFAAGRVDSVRELFDQWSATPWLRSLRRADRARLLYWEARLAWLTGAGQQAVELWSRVRDDVPLSYEGVMADAWLVRAGEASRIRPLVRAAFQRDEGAARLEPAALAGLELLELGFDELARTELAWQSQLRGDAAPVAGAAAAGWMSARGERGAAIWTMGRQAEPARWSHDEVVDVPSVGWRSGWPLVHLRALYMASDATGQPVSRLLAFARRESAFVATASSAVGARGLMQLLPETARIQARDVTEIDTVTRRDLDDPRINARLGAQMLVAMDERYGGCVELMSSAYSAGPGRADDWLRQTPRGFSDVWTERIPYPVVRGYAREVVVSEVLYAALLDEPHRSALCELPVGR